MVAVNVIVADTDEEAQRLATSQQQQFLNLIRRQTGPLRPPVDDIERIWSPEEKALIQRQLGFSAIGSPTTVRAKLEEIVQVTHADELIVAAQIYDHSARLRSYELFSKLARQKES
ncbi:hypothetical protein D3C73_1403250 [compost metagenome]